MRNKITIQDLSRELSLTAATVSRALNNHPRISINTKRSVSDLAEKLNYRRNHLASSLRLCKSHTIGVIIPRADINFFGSVIHGIESIANDNGYRILPYQSNESPRYEIQAIESFIGVKVDGILASIAKETSDFSHYVDLKKRGIPLVFFDSSKESLEIPSVVIDNFKGGYLAAKHLVARGYTRIAHISGQQHLKIFRDRLSGYTAALEESGCTVDKSLIYNGDVSIDAGKNAMEYYFNLADPPDAVFAVEDFTALGMIKAAKEKISIPGQLGVIGSTRSTPTRRTRTGQQPIRTKLPAEVQTPGENANRSSKSIQPCRDRSATITPSTSIQWALPRLLKGWKPNASEYGCTIHVFQTSFRLFISRSWTSTRTRIKSSRVLDISAGLITAGSGRVAATFKAEKIITDAVNAKNIEGVTLYINKTQFVSGDGYQNIASTSINSTNITDINNITMNVTVPDFVPMQNYVFGRIGLKIAGLEDAIYSPVVKVTF